MHACAGAARAARPSPPPARRAPSSSRSAGALLVAVAAIMYSTAPGEEPRAAPRPAGPSLDQRLRAAVAPALAADAKLSKELSSLVPGANPDDARDRGPRRDPRDRVARTAVSELRATSAAERLLAPARDARSARSPSTSRSSVLALALQADDGQLDPLGPVSARLVSRLERIETAVPRASETVGGARRLKAWVSAELAAQAPPPSNPAAPRTADAATRTGRPRTDDDAAPGADGRADARPHGDADPLRRRARRAPAAHPPPPRSPAAAAGGARGSRPGRVGRVWASPEAAPARTRAAAGRRRRAGRARGRSRRWPARARRACARTSGSPPGRS